MARFDGVTISLRLPFVGEISGTWAPDAEQRDAAWELYVELVTRIGVVPLATDHGLLREALSSLYSLFGSTRMILRQHGPQVARPAAGGDLSVGYLALEVLNTTLRPLLARWHPELTAHEERRPPYETARSWEQNWVLASDLRDELAAANAPLSGYASLLAKIAGVQPVHVPPAG